MKKDIGRTQKAAKNIGYNLINQIISLTLSFVARTVFIEGFGVGLLGINGLFGDILNLLSMADLGFNTAMTYSFYKPLAEKNYKKIAGLVTFYKKVYHTIAAAITVIGISLIPFLPKLINLDYEVPHINIYYLLSLATVVASYLCVYKTTILSADQKGYLLTRITIYTNLAKTIFQILSIIICKNYIIYLIIGTGFTIMNNVYASYVANKEYPYIRERIGIDNSEKREIFNNLQSVFLYKISSMLLNATDNILISTIIGTVIVGYYSNYLLLQTKIITIISLFFTSITASIGNLIVTEKSEKRYKVFQCEQSISYVICGIVIPCYVLLADDFVRIWLGNEFELGFVVTCAIGLNMYLSCVMQPLWSYREATGLYRKTKWIMVFCALINIILSVFLGRKIGIVGIIIASAISRISTYVWYEPKVLFKDYFEESEKIYYAQLVKNVLILIALIILGKQVERLFVVNSVIHWVEKAFLIGGISSMTMFLIYRNSEGIKYIEGKIRNKFTEK